MSKNNSTVIEFVGPPGSGKTTTAKELVKIMQKKEVKNPPALEVQQARQVLHGNKKLPVPDRIRTLLLGTVEVPRKVLASYRLSSSVNKADITNILRGYNIIRWKLIETRIRRQSEYDYIIFSEGALHVICLLAMKGRVQGIEQYGSLVTHDRGIKRYVVNVATPTEVCVSRIKERKKKERFDQMSEDKISGMIEMYNMCLREIMKVPSSRNVIKVDGTENPKINAREVSDYILNNIDGV